MKKISLLFLSCLGLFVLLNSAFAASTRPENCAQRPYDHGKLWEVRKAGFPKSYIFGTMHSKDPRILYLPGIVMQAFNSSTVFILETTLTDKSIRESRALMLAPHGQTLKAATGSDRYAALLTIAKQYGISSKSLNQFKIWAAASIFAQPPQPRNTRLTLLDRELESTARKMGKPIIALEKAIDQLGLFDRLPQKVQLELLDQTILEFPSLGAELEKLTEHYIAGRTGWIFCELESSLAPLSPELNDFMTRQLITQRNKKMAARILPRLEKDKTFVAIGALHLPGVEGVLSLLAKHGYKITRRF